jgi:hypothetical protein
MTAKTQAEILVDEYFQLLGEHIFNGHFDLAKDCALIAFDKLIEEFDNECSTSIYYWNEVKQEIEKL